MSDEIKEGLVEITDPVTQSKVSVSADVQTLIGHMISMERRITNEKADAKYKPFLEKSAEYQNQNEGLMAELEKVKSGNQTDGDKAAEQYEIALKKFEEEKAGLSDQVNVWQGRYQADKIRNDVYAAFGTTHLSNPEQACILFITEGNAQVKPVFGSDGKETGEYQTVMRLTITDGEKVEDKEGTPKELFSDWINQKKNAHHLLSTLQSGGGTFKGLNGSDNNTAQILAMKPEERIMVGRAE